MENKSLGRSFTNWFSCFFSGKKKRAEKKDSLEESLIEELKRQEETQRLIDKTTEQSAQSEKKLSDITNQMIEKKWEMIDKMNRNRRKL